MVIIAGLPGFGKSRYTQIGLASHPHAPRQLVIDPHAVLDRSMNNPERSPWEGELVTYQELLDHDGADMLACAGTLIVDPGTLDQVVLGRRVSRLLMMAWKTTNWDVVLEEAGLYSRSAIPLINLLATGGGHASIRLMLIAQSLGRITIDARRNATHLVLWPQSDPQDYVELRHKIGAPGIALLQSMNPHDPPVTWKQGQIGPG